MHIEFDNRDHLSDFVRLNEQRIAEHFGLEEADRKLAADPGSVIDGGGHILSLVDRGRVVGVCALFREEGGRYPLARMAVDPASRGRGYGDALLGAAVERARADGAR